MYRTRNLPKTFDDLPFPILNRSHDVGLFIRSLNNSLNIINYGTEAYFIENGEDRIELKEASCKTLYWIYLNKAEVSLPWKPKWEHHFTNLEINWNIVWQNVHNNMLQYKVQSKLWEFMNLNFISSFNLNRMYNTSNLCLQCKLPEENLLHILVYCPISKKEL